MRSERARWRQALGASQVSDGGGSCFADAMAKMSRSLPADDSAAYCYAGFEHAQLDADNNRRLTFSYSTNTTDFGSMIRHPNVYWPRPASFDLADAGL